MRSRGRADAIDQTITALARQWASFAHVNLLQ
jgi:hypothetical protein